LLSLTFWSRGAAIASVTIIAVCGFLVVDDELHARRARAELQDFWLPAREMDHALLDAELEAGDAIAAFLDAPSERGHQAAQRSVAQIQQALDSARLPEGSPELLPQAMAARHRARSWLTDNASIIAIASPSRAHLASLASEQALARATQQHLAELDSGAAEVRQSLRRTTSVLRITVVIQTLLLILLVALLMLGLRFRVLAPLLRLRSDLERSSRQMAHAIRPTGPPEISAVAHDAEALRRSLMVAHDTSDHAMQALAQSSPLTIAVRSQLDRHDQDVPGVIGYHRPAEGVIAGDWWWAGEDGQGARMLALADVSGHGVPAGMLALESRTLVMAALKRGDSPERICTELASGSFLPGMFLTLFIAVLRDGSLEYCSAGHQDAALVSTRSSSALAATGPIISPLGGSWQLARLRMAGDSVLIAATDGLLELAPQSSFPPFAQRAWNRSGQQPAECLELLIARARERSSQWTDDVTVVIAH